MKNFIWKFLLIILLSTNLFIYKVHATTNLELDAKGVVLMDGITGNILFSKNPDTQFEPASTTKIMTALVTLDKVSLDDKVTIGINPPLIDGSIISMSTGEVFTVRELLLGLLLESGNDAAEALAEHISGSNAAFGVLMTEKAKEIGAMNTTFKNPSGLHEEGHITTAYDLALIMKEAYASSKFNEIARTPNYFYKNNLNLDGSEKWAHNKNHVINPDTNYYYKYAYSGKTGYTPEANHTYAAAATKDDQVLISSFLNAENKDAHFLSIGPLFEYGFQNFETIKLVSKGDKIADYKIDYDTTIPLISNKDYYYNKSKSIPAPDIEFSYKSRDLSKDTITNGQLLFTGTISLNNEIYDEIEFISGVDRDYTFKVSVDQSIHKLTENIFLLIFLSLSILILLFLLFIKLKRRNRRHRIYRKSTFLKKFNCFRNSNRY